ncbi:MAG: DeoR/GlpR family DNA-binding transcription regulator [Bacteroidales bacterium]|nr:DeoR/GlpR family DNA-binding transcription regulator [Bacteroidales bacterium]
MRQINLHNKVLSVDLSTLLNVSEDTIRRDLKELADAQLIKRVHGGAVNKSMVRPFIADQNIYSLEEKIKIASKAIKLLKNDMVLLFEGGTTMFEVAKSIPDNLNLTVFTISPQIAIALSEHKNIDVYTIGGKLNRNSNIHVGTRTINVLRRVQYDMCFMGVNALSVDRGLTDIDIDVVEVNRAMLDASNKTVFISISEKLNVEKRYQVAELSSVDFLVTELSPDDQLLKPFKDNFNNLNIL